MTHCKPTFNPIGIEATYNACAPINRFQEATVLIENCFTNCPSLKNLSIAAEGMLVLRESFLPPLRTLLIKDTLVCLLGWVLHYLGRLTVEQQSRLRSITLENCKLLDDAASTFRAMQLGSQGYPGEEKFKSESDVYVVLLS